MSDTFTQAAKQIAEARSQAIAAYEEAGNEEAEAENRYRKNKATAMAGYRDQNKAQDESLVLAESDAADDRKARDLASVKRHAAKERIAECEANRAMLRESSERWRTTGGG